MSGIRSIFGRDDFLVSHLRSPAGAEKVRGNRGLLEVTKPNPTKPGASDARKTSLAATDELGFFERHKNFDHCSALNSLVRAVVRRYNPAPDWRNP